MQLKKYSRYTAWYPYLVQTHDQNLNPQTVDGTWNMEEVKAQHEMFNTDYESEEEDEESSFLRSTKQMKNNFSLLLYIYIFLKKFVKYFILLLYFSSKP